MKAMSKKKKTKRKNREDGGGENMYDGVCGE
jgi:hypothetical protein